MKSNFSKLTAMLFLAVLFCVVLPPFKFQAFTNTTFIVTPDWPTSMTYRSYGNQQYDFVVAGHTVTSTGWVFTVQQSQILDSSLNSYLASVVAEYSAFTGFLDMGFQCDFNITVNSPLESDIMIYFLGFQYYRNFQSSWNSPVAIEKREVYDPNPKLVFSQHVNGSNSAQTFVARPFCRSRAYLDMPFTSGSNQAALTANVSYSFLPEFRVVVSSASQSVEYSIVLSNYQFLFYPIFANRNSDNTYNYTYLAPFSPYNVPDFRFIEALQHIWSAINGGDSVGNLSDDIKQQTQDITQGYVDPTVSDANDSFDDAVVKLDNSQSQALYLSGEGYNEFMDSGGFDSYDNYITQQNEPLSWFKTTIDSVLNHPLLKYVVSVVVALFVASVVIGVRRFI